MRKKDNIGSSKAPVYDSITITFKEDFKTFRINEEYPFRINTEIDKKYIWVTSNNGLIKLSKDEDFDFVIYPKKNGELTLRFFENIDGEKREFYTAKLIIE